MEREAQVDIKKMINKGTGSSVMTALGTVFQQFMDKNVSLMKDLPRPMFDTMVKYVKEDVFKYAKLAPNVKLKNFLERYQREVGDITEALPGPASRHFTNLLKAVSKPSVQRAEPSKAPGKAEQPSKTKQPQKGKKPAEEPSEKTQDKSEEKAPVSDEKKAMDTLSKFLKKNHYKELFPKLPRKVQQDLDKVGLAPQEMKIARFSGIRVARMFIERQ